MDQGGAHDQAQDAARAAMRIGSEYLLRSLKMLTDMMQGEMVTAVVALAIGQANVAHFDYTEAEARYRDTGVVPPDELRRPVSVLALSQSLGLPYETTRRHVEKLVQLGVCDRIKGGVLIPSRAIDNDWHRQMLAANLANQRRLFRALKAAGADLD